MINRLILASASEWRARLLREAGFEFEVLPTDIDEEPYQQSIKDPKTLVETLALKKVEACQLKVDPNDTILGADTIVWIDNQIIGKPTDRQDAKRIISLLQGNTHQVWTGVCIKNKKTIIFSEKTAVTFKTMTESEIETYLNTNDWLGKAGAYQLQKSISKYVAHIEGDQDNIIGLPSSTYSKLCSFIH
jgi:septum formation protein